MSQLQQLPVYILCLAVSVTPVRMCQTHAYLRKRVKGYTMLLHHLAALPS